MRKVFLLSLLVVLIVIVVIVSLGDQRDRAVLNDQDNSSVALISTQTDETATWEVFEGEDFSIKHPSTFSVTKGLSVSSPEYPESSPMVRLDSTDLDQDPTTITITVADNILGLNLDDGLGNGPLLRYVDSFLVGKTTQRLTIDGVEAVLVEDIAAGQAGSISDLIMFKEVKVYQINLSPVTPLNLQLLQTMLSTFKFKDEFEIVNLFAFNH